MEKNQVTIFRNIKDTSTPFFRDIESILVRIKEGTSKELIRQIRSEKDKEVRQEDFVLTRPSQSLSFLDEHPFSWLWIGCTGSKV